MKIRQQKRRIAARRRILGLEQLERREVLAGNVAASLRGGDLFLNGDNLANDISITRIGPNSVTIAGNGTTVNGQAAVTFNNYPSAPHGQPEWRQRRGEFRERGR